MLALIAIGVVGALVVASQAHRLGFREPVCIAQSIDEATCTGHPVLYWLRALLTLVGALGIAWFAVVAHVGLIRRRGGGGDVGDLLPLPLDVAALYLAGSSWWDAASTSSLLSPPMLVLVAMAAIAVVGIVLAPRLFSWLAAKPERLDRVAMGVLAGYLVLLAGFAGGASLSLAATSSYPALAELPAAPALRATAGWLALFLVALLGAAATATVIARRGRGAARMALGILIVTVLLGAATGFATVDRDPFPPGSTQRVADR